MRQIVIVTMIGAMMIVFLVLLAILLVYLPPLAWS